MQNLPASVSEIALPGGPQHRQYTHRGWNDQINYLFDEDQKERWLKRKEVLRNTVYKVFDYNQQPFWLSWLPFFHDEKSEMKYDSFCALVYYVHILGDYLEDSNYQQFNGNTNGRKVAFARSHADEENIDLFFELQIHLSKLFF